MWVFDSSNALRKALWREKNKKNKFKSCFPLRDDEDFCGNLVLCPRRLFPVFDCFKNPNTGTLICEAHWNLLIKSRESAILNEAYTPPKKGRTFASVNSTLSRNITLRNKTICGRLRQPPPPTDTPPVTDLFVWLALKVTINRFHESKPWQWRTSKKNWRTWKWQKNWKMNKEKQKKKTHPWWKKLKVCATVNMKEISLATKDKTWNDIICCFEGMQNK